MTDRGGSGADANRILAELTAARDSQRGAPERGGKFAAWVLSIVGGVCVFLGLFPKAQESFSGSFDITQILLVVVGIQSIHIAVLIRSHHQLRRRFRDLLGHLMDVFGGKNYRRHREAIDILIQALDGEDPQVLQTAIANLRRLTGEDFGNNPEAWKSWWAGHRRTFRPPSSPADETSEA